jgi:hypothetical protein
MWTTHREFESLLRSIHPFYLRRCLYKADMLAGKNVQELCTLLFPTCFFLSRYASTLESPQEQTGTFVSPTICWFWFLAESLFCILPEKRSVFGCSIGHTVLFSWSIFGFQSNIVVEAIQCILLVRRSEQCIELLHYHLILSLPCRCLLSGLARSSVEIVALCPSLKYGRMI